MADQKISALNADTSPLDTDIVPMVDLVASQTKKITWTSIKAFLKTYFDTLYVAPNQDTTGKSAKTDALNSATTVVNVSASVAPSTGNALIATDSTHATWQSITTVLKTIIAWNLNGGVNAATTTFNFGNNSSGTEASQQTPMPLAGTVKNLYVRTQTTQDAGGTLVITVRKNGSSQTLTLTIGAGATANTFSDTTHSFTIAAGDLLTIQLVNNSPGSGSATIAGISLEIDPT